MITHAYQKYLLAICKSAIAMMAALIPGCSPHVNYPVNSENSQENSDHPSQDSQQQSMAMRDATAPSFISKSFGNKEIAQPAFIETYDIKANVTGMFVQIEETDGPIDGHEKGHHQTHTCLGIVITLFLNV